MISTSAALRDYLHVDMCNLRRERVRTLYLNVRNELLLDEETTTGTIDAAPIYAREIIGRAIEIGSTSLIVIHNHPSGDPRPSREDVRSTVCLAKLCSGVGVSLLDHLIVGRREVLSLRAMGLLGE